VTSVYEFTVWESLLTILWFFLFVIWIWLLISIFSDIFRSDDLSGWGKALWLIFVIFLPYLGVFVYLIARGKEMAEHRVRDVAQREEQMRSYVKDVASSSSTADEIERLAQLQASGAITEEEFRQAKAKLLA
jgi:ABC-type multidrug transport system fused ATPase/permease subunit